MQILQWLFNMSAQEPPKIVSKSTSITQTKRDEDKKMKQKNTVVPMTEHDRRRQLKGVERSKLNCENLVLFRFLQRKDVSRPFFYQTLNLKGLGSFRGSRKTRRREEIERAALAVNKVLPINVHHHAVQSSSTNILKQLSDSDKRDFKTKTHKKKAVFRVKDLLKWAATAKNVNGKAASNVDQDCDESPKISISWRIIESCPTTTTTTTTTYTTSLRDEHIECGDLCAGIGNWITTDSEFVVLEL